MKKKDKLCRILVVSGSWGESKTFSKVSGNIFLLSHTSYRYSVWGGGGERTDVSLASMSHLCFNLFVFLSLLSQKSLSSPIPQDLFQILLVGKINCYNLFLNVNNF